MNLTEKEAKSFVSISLNCPAETEILINYLSNRHEKSRDKMEDADSDDDRLRAQGVCRDLRDLKNIFKEAKIYMDKVAEYKRQTSVNLDRDNTLDLL